MQHNYTIMWESRQKLTVWKNEKFSINEKKKIRKITYLVISLVKPMLSQNFCEKSVRENFHTVKLFIPKIKHFSVKSRFLLKKLLKS